MFSNIDCLIRAIFSTSQHCFADRLGASVQNPVWKLRNIFQKTRHPKKITLQQVHLPIAVSTSPKASPLYGGTAAAISLSHTHARTHTKYSLVLLLSRSLSHTLSLSLSLTHTQTTLSLSLTHTLSRSDTHTHKHSISLSLSRSL